LGGVFIDVGAHVGKYTVLVSKIVGPDGMVIALEPNPENFKALKRNIKLNNLRNVVAYNVAASNKTGPLKFFAGDDSACFSVENRYSRGTVTVKAQLLDEIVNELNLNRVDLVKIDVEGGEYEVLLGLEETLRIFRPKVILEVWMENIDRVAAFFDRLGYNIKALSEVSEFNIGTPDYDWCIDVLCSPQ
jgi:FkbM family methyltransferase